MLAIIAANYIRPIADPGERATLPSCVDVRTQKRKSQRPPQHPVPSHHVEDGTSLRLSDTNMWRQKSAILPVDFTTPALPGNDEITALLVMLPDLPRHRTSLKVISKKPAMPTTKRISRFMTLPPEIRSRIIKYSIQDVPSFIGLGRRNNMPALLQVCSQLRRETAELLFSTRVVLMSLCSRSLKGLDPNFRKYIKVILNDLEAASSDARNRAALRDKRYRFNGGTFFLKRSNEPAMCKVEVDCYVNSRGRALSVDGLKGKTQATFVAPPLVKQEVC